MLGQWLHETEGISMRIFLFEIISQRTNFMNPLAKLIQADLRTFASNILFNVSLYTCMCILITSNVV